MRIKSRTLNVERFKKDFSKLFSKAERFYKLNPRYIWNYTDADSLLNIILPKIEEVNGDITSFLKNLDSLEDSKVQMWCSQASIAQMFNVYLSDREGLPYTEVSFHSNDIILIQCDRDANFETTCIVSKYGKIIFHEGKFRTHDGMNYGYGFPIMDMTNNRKVGFITNSGVRVLPCEFDYYSHESPMHWGQTELPIMIYGIWSYELRKVSEGPLTSISKDDLERIIRMYDGDREFGGIYFLSEDSSLYKLCPELRFTRDDNNKLHREFLSKLDCNRSVQEEAAVEANGHTDTTIEEANDAIKAFLSKYIITKEKLQELLDSK